MKDFPVFPETEAVVQSGITFRAYIATMVMAGLASNDQEFDGTEAADIAVNLADALIEELSKPKPASHVAEPGI